MRRDAGIDIVRTVGIVAIVAAHIWSNELTFTAFYPWHVPVFFFLTGYLWRPKTFRAELRARTASLMKPYAFWFAVIYVAFIAWALNNGIASFEVLAPPIYGGLAATRPFTTFWFVFVLFAAVILWRALHHAPAWARWAVVAAATLAAPLVGPVLARTPLAVGTALLAIVFISAGEEARKHEGKLGRARPYAALIALAASAALVASELSDPVNLKQGDWGTPVLSIVVASAISWAMVTLASIVAPMLGRHVGSAVTLFALCGYAIMLAHPAVLWLMQPFTVPSRVLFVIAVGAPFLTAWTALHLPVSQWVTGSKRLDRAKQRA